MKRSPRSAVEPRPAQPRPAQPRPAQPRPLPATGFSGVLSYDIADRTAGASLGDTVTLGATGLEGAVRSTVDDRTATHRVRVETAATAERTFPGVHLPAD